MNFYNIPAKIQSQYFFIIFLGMRRLNYFRLSIYLKQNTE